MTVQQFAPARKMTEEGIYEALRAPFPDSAIKFRAFRTTNDKSKAKFTPYVRKNTLVERLDSLFGFDWSAQYQTSEAAGKLPGVICRLSLKIGDTWHSREGAGCQLNDKTEQTGQNYSLVSSVTTSFAAAAESWGMGAYLYGYETDWRSVDQWGNPTEAISVSDLILQGSATSSSGGGSGSSQNASSGSKKYTYPTDFDGMVAYEWPWGKHKGLTVDEISAANTDFFKWVLENYDSCKAGHEKYDPAFHRFVDMCDKFARNVGEEQKQANELFQEQKQEALFAPQAGMTMQYSGDAAVMKLNDICIYGRERGVERDHLIKEFKARFGVVVDFANRKVSPFTDTVADQMMAYIDAYQLGM